MVHVKISLHANFSYHKIPMVTPQKEYVPIFPPAHNCLYVFICLFFCEGRSWSGQDIVQWLTCTHHHNVCKDPMKAELDLRKVTIKNNILCRG